MGLWDIFWASSDRAWTIARYQQVTASDATWTFAAQGVLVNTSAGVNGYQLGCVVLIRQGGKPDGYAYVAKKPSNTQVYLIPLQSSLAPTAVGTVYGNTATITAGMVSTTPAYETHATMVIDLTDAPELSYTYLIVGDAGASHGGANRVVQVVMRSSALVDDPYSGDAVGEAIFDVNVEDWQYNVVKEVTLAGGQRYEFHLQVVNGFTGSRARLMNGHLLAIRVDGWTGYTRSTSNADAAASSSATTTDVTHATVTVPLTGNYVAFACGLVSHSSATAADRISEVKFKVGGVTALSARIKLPQTTDRVPIGVMASVAGTTAGAVAISVNNQGATGSASIEKGIVAIASLDDLPAWIAAKLADAQATANITAPAEFTLGVTSADQAITAGTYIEAITTGAGIATGVVATDYYSIRPVWEGDYSDDQVKGSAAVPLEYENDLSPRGSFGHMGVSATGQANSLNFFLWRGERSARSASANLVQVKYLGASHNVLVAATRFLWLREAAVPTAGAARKILTAVEMERGKIFKAWDPTGTTGLYQIAVPDALRVGRCLLNGVEVTQAAVQVAAPKLTTAGTWGWDRVARRAYIYMPALPAGRTPADDRETVVLVVEEFVAPRALTLFDSDGEYRPYAPELEETPGVETKLQVRESGTEVATSIGDLSLVNAHAKWDDVAMKENFAGLYATVRRGLAAPGGINKTLLRSLQVIAKATIDMPEIARDGESFKLGLFDRGLQLRRPLSESRITVYEGNAAASGPRDYVPLLIGYGMKLKRMQAYRVTNDAASPTSHFFKVFQHPVVAFGNVYLAPDATTPVTTGAAPTAADLLCAQFKVFNTAGGGSDAAYKLDSLYVDVLGGQGAGVENVGTIIEHLLTNYPQRIDEYAGTPLTTLSTVNHTSSTATANAQVAATTGFAVGDRVKVTSQAAATTYYHATVTAILAGPARLTLMPEYQTGDAVVGTVFTFGAAAEVRKVVTAGGLALTDLARASMRLFDRKWRRQYAAGAFSPLAPDLNLLLDPTVTVDEAITKLMRVFGFSFANPVGRIELGVVDDDAACQTGNPGFEFDLVTSPATARSLYPWNEEGGLTSAMSTSVKASGQQSAEITMTTGQAQQDTALGQDMIVAKPGEFVAATALVALRAGDGTSVRLAFSDPSSPLRAQVSDPFEVQSGAWTRISAPFPVPAGAAGRARVKIVPHYPEFVAPIPAVLGSSFLGTLVPATGVKGWITAREIASPLPQNGSKVNTWAALAGTAATGSGGARPRWWKNACFHQPAVSFDNFNDTLAWITLSTAAYTVFVVYAPTTTDAAFHRALSGGTSNWLMGPHKGATSNLLYHAYTGGAGGATAGYVGAGALVEAANSFACCALVATSANLSEHFVNGSSVGTNTATGQGVPGVLNLGAGGAAVEPLFGRVAEVIVYETALAPADRVAVEEYLMKTYGIRSATLAVDDFRCFPVAAVLDQHNSVSFPVEFDPDTFYEAQVSYDVNTQDTSIASYIRVTDSEARGLTTAISQAKNALPNAQRLIVDDLLVTDAASAAGIAAAYANYFASPRHRLRLMWRAPARVPKVGERVFHWDHRVPELADRNPIHLLTGVSVGEGNTIELESERQNDFVSDRLTIAASDFPIGLIFATVSTTCPAGSPPYSEEVIGLRGFYLVGAATADLSTVVGSPTHRHALDHTHPTSSHSHTFTIPAQTAGDPSPLPDIDLYTRATGPHVFRSVARGVSEGGHQHVISPASTGRATSAATPTSSSAAIFTFYGSNDVTWKRVTFCKRIGGTGTFPTDMILGYNGAASAPAGWGLCDGAGGRPDLLDVALRGARDNDGTDTTIKAATTHTQTNDPAGGNLDLTDPSRVKRYERVRVVSGGNTFTGVVVVGPGENGLAVDRCKVQSLHEDADAAADGTVYAAASAVQIDDQRASAVKVTVVAHRHAVTTAALGTGAVPSHTHTAAHGHPATLVYTLPANSFGTVTAEMDTAFGFPDYSTATHVHLLNVTLPTYSGASGSAGGDITSASTNRPDRYRMPFMVPTAGQSVLPVLSVAWSDDVCPEGFEHLSATDGLLIVGAAAGIAAGAVAEGHSHTYNAASHTFTHDHGGSATGLLTDPDVDSGWYTNADGLAQASFTGQAPTGHYATTTWPTAYGPWPGILASGGHVHTINITTIQSTAATLTAASSQVSAVSSGSGSIPPAKRLVTCVKV